jgi:hypothetical protein
LLVHPSPGRQRRKKGSPPRMAQVIITRNTKKMNYARPRRAKGMFNRWQFDCLLDIKLGGHVQYLHHIKKTVRDFTNHKAMMFGFHVGIQLKHVMPRCKK